MRLLILFLGCFVAHAGLAQEVWGRLIDSSSKDPVPFASLAVHEGDTLIAITQSDFDGNFEVRSRRGFNSLHIRASGYHKLVVDQTQFRRWLDKPIIIELLEGLVSPHATIIKSRIKCLQDSSGFIRCQMVVD